MHFAPNMCLFREDLHRREGPGRVTHRNIFHMFFNLFRWELLGCFVLSFFSNSSSDIEISYLWRNKVLKEVMNIVNLLHIEWKLHFLLVNKGLILVTFTFFHKFPLFGGAQADCRFGGRQFPVGKIEEETIRVDEENIIELLW